MTSVCDVIRITEVSMARFLPQSKNNQPTDCRRRERAGHNQDIQLPVVLVKANDNTT